MSAHIKDVASVIGTYMSDCCALLASGKENETTLFFQRFLFENQCPKKPRFFAGKSVVFDTKFFLMLA